MQSGKCKNFMFFTNNRYFYAQMNKDLMVPN